MRYKYIVSYTDQGRLVAWAVGDVLEDVKKSARIELEAHIRETTGTFDQLDVLKFDFRQRRIDTLIGKGVDLNTGERLSVKGKSGASNIAYRCHHP